MITEAQVMDLFRSMRLHRLPTQRHLFISCSRAMVSVRFDADGALMSVRFIPHADATAAEQTSYDACEFAGIEGMRAFLSFDMSRHARARATRARETFCRRRTLALVSAVHALIPQPAATL